MIRSDTTQHVESGIRYLFLLKSLREKHGLSQDQLAERVMVIRQAVSRWETGGTQPNTDTLQLLSKEFNVSINTLLGNPRQLIPEL